MNKVYCKNCKYFTGGFCEFPEYCNYPDNLNLGESKIKDTHKEKGYIYHYLIQESLPNKINEKNDCKWYKRKWYIFWVKK